MALDDKPHLNEADISLHTSKPFHLAVPVSFGLLRKTIKVSVSLREIIRCPDTYLWAMTLTSRNVSFKVENTSDVEFEVVALHPDPDLLKPRGKGWDFEGVMLVGQSLEIHTRHLSTQSR